MSVLAATPAPLVLSEEKQPRQLPSSIPDFVDWQRLEQNLDPNLDERDRRAGKQIIHQTYEANPRMVADNSGLVFPMNPELLAYAMALGKGRTVVEVAGADGMNAILLALGGAERVYMNERLPQEIDRFQANCRPLSPQMQGKLIAVEGDCLHLLDSRPEIRGKADLILCRNFVHFLTGRQEAPFSEMLKDTLAPNGRAIITANSFLLFPMVEEGDRVSTCFRITQALITDRKKSSGPAKIIPLKAQATEADAVSFSHHTTYIYDRQEGEKWTVNQTAFRQIAPDLQPLVQRVVDENRSLLKSIKDGSFRVLETVVRMFTPFTLTKMMTERGLLVEEVFGIDNMGHRVARDSPEAQHWGVIVRKGGSN